MTELIISALMYLDQSKNPEVVKIVKEIQILDWKEDCNTDLPSKIQDYKDRQKCFLKSEIK